MDKYGIEKEVRTMKFMGKMRSPGNRATGEKHGSAKLTQQKANKIKELYAEGKFSQRKLAQMFGVSADTINKIVNGKRW